MFDRLKNANLTWAEFLWKLPLVGFICVPVPILGFGLGSYYLCQWAGWSGFLAGLTVGFLSSIGAGIALWLVVVVVLSGHK